MMPGGRGWNGPQLQETPGWTQRTREASVSLLSSVLDVHPLLHFLLQPEPWLPPCVSLGALPRTIPYPLNVWKPPSLHSQGATMEPLGNRDISLHGFTSWWTRFRIWTSIGCCRPKLQHVSESINCIALNAKNGYKGFSKIPTSNHAERPRDKHFVKLTWNSQIISLNQDATAGVLDIDWLLIIVPLKWPLLLKMPDRWVDSTVQLCS